MKRIRYSKYTGEPWDEIDLQDLVGRLGDYFLQSGFDSQFYGFSRMDPERSMEELREAILRALQEGDFLPDELREQLDSNPDFANSSEMREFLDQLIERLEREGRTAIAQACFEFLPTRARLDIAGWAEHDIFSHA